MEVVGLVGAVLGIIDVTTRCISSLTEIRQRFSSANVTVELLSGQLVTVKAALGQIHDLINESIDDEHHYQLTLDLSVGINCCNLLIRVLEEQITKLQYSDADELSFNSKVVLLLESKGTEECLARLDRQINALNLLITAFQSRTLKEQQNFLEQKQPRKVFDQIKDDSTSLIVLCDSESFTTKRTKTTTATSKLSMNFVFDAELLQAKAYKSTLRSLIRKNLHSTRTARSEANGEQRAIPKKNKVSAPENPVHMIHVGFDAEKEEFTGLPSEWQKLLDESDVGNNDRQQLQAHFSNRELRYPPSHYGDFDNPRLAPDSPDSPDPPRSPVVDIIEDFERLHSAFLRQEALLGRK